MSSITRLLPRFRRPALGLILAGCASAANAQTAPNTSTNSPTELPPVIITAQKKVENVQSSTVSVTAVPKDALEMTGARYVNDVAPLAPNTFINEFSARKLSNPRFRGIGGSPNNQGITTYIDGVPQLHGNIASQELIGIDQVDFVRGPQGALYGRNTVGGLIDIRSLKPSLTDWDGGIQATYGNYEYKDVRIDFGGPITADKVGLSLSGGYSGRDGYTQNVATGADIDNREAVFGKGQLLFAPNENWEVRLIVAGETADDGDYALGDLNAIRANPHQVNRNAPGSATRDIFSTSLLANYRGGSVDFDSITGIVGWETVDTTDIAYALTPVSPVILRSNTEKAGQFSQEFRVSSPADAPLELGDSLSLKWQTGVLLFTQNYEQTAINNIPAFFSASQEVSELNDFGAGIYGQTTLTAFEKLDFTAGIRGDYEDKEAELYNQPLFAAPIVSSLGNSYTSVSPHFGVAYRFTDKHLVYGTLTRGYKAGGFNSIAPAGSQEYEEESSWNYETGFKTVWFEDRVHVNIAAFYTHWDDVQLNAPTGTGSFYIDNVGSAHSKGVELDVKARVMPGWDVFAGAGYTEARFLNGSYDNNSNVFPVGAMQHVGGNKLAYSPDYTVYGGTQAIVPVCDTVNVFFRADVTAYGQFAYDAVNGASQSAYSIANFRAG
ncbi:MAG: TonB-dependent receptor, partial [Verrucomicrobia bacterium]|nr:TonB-dependent receptor [Verrucomicrobiota bacterium]